MATWILPVTVGRTHAGKEVGVAIGTFPTADEALAHGVRMVKAGEITEFVEPIEQMTLRQFAAWRAAQREQNTLPAT